ncbi:MAG: LPS assembly lipoprotein LptE [Amoebophilaceae bacterium]|jgi:hypothetical protein|nr:LPS assembly lipoprotein LptE [Amoebophilaceae bacterium]
MIWNKSSIVLAFCLLLSQGCGIYSFSGISLPPKAKTFSLHFQSNVALGPTDLATRFQQRLSEELLQRTSLKQVHTEGDLQLDGVIEKFDYIPATLTKSDKEDIENQAPMSRLMIEAQLNYVNLYDEASGFSKKTFSQYDNVDTDASSGFDESGLIEAIFTKLVEDIFNETLANW